MKRYPSIVFVICAAGLAGTSLLNAQPRRYVVNDEYIYEHCLKRAPEAVLFAQQDLARANQALQLARQGKASSRVKEITLLPNGHLVYPDARAKPVFIKLCEGAVQLAQQRLQAARSSPAPDLRGSLTAGDVGVLNGEAVVEKILSDNQALIKGKFTRPARTTQTRRELLPPGWTSATSAEELLDMGEDAPPERTVLLAGRATKDLQPGQKTDLLNVGVVVESPQPIDSTTGLIVVPVVRATDIPAAIYRHAQALERERRKKEEEEKERRERERKKRDSDKDDKGRK